MHNNLAVIIQARVGSSRLPNKVILPFYNSFSILEIIISRLKQLNNTLKIILATTTNTKDNKIAEIAIKNNITLFRGDENNVLDRFITCAEKNNIDKIIRICADNPFLLNDYIDILIDRTKDDNAFDYVSYKNFKNIPAIKTHIGLFAEYVNLKSLREIQNKTTEKLYQEHVTNYIYTHPDFFEINLLPFPDILIKSDDLRFTCDTLDDFNMLKQLYAEYITVFKSDKIILENLLSIVSYNKEYLKVMQKGIKQFQK